MTTEEKIPPTSKQIRLVVINEHELAALRVAFEAAPWGKIKNAAGLRPLVEQYLARADQCFAAKTPYVTKE